MNSSETCVCKNTIGKILCKGSKRYTSVTIVGYLNTYVKLPCVLGLSQGAYHGLQDTIKGVFDPDQTFNPYNPYMCKYVTQTNENLKINEEMKKTYYDPYKVFYSVGYKNFTKYVVPRLLVRLEYMFKKHEIKNMAMSESQFDDIIDLSTTGLFDTTNDVINTFLVNVN
jgi:hypothetical protein